jgi:hypothetical protein
MKLTETMKKAIKVANMQTGRGRIFYEVIRSKFGTSASFFSCSNKKNIYKEEECRCGASSPEECTCKYIFPLTPSNPNIGFTKKEFDSDKPYLLYTIFQEKNPDNKFMFVAKDEHNVLEETNRLTKKYGNSILWIYKEETLYNTRTKADSEYYKRKNENILTDQK